MVTRAVPAWRIAWYHPRTGHWQLALYEYREEAAAAAVAALLQQQYGMRTALIATTASLTDHGAEA